MWGLCVGKGGIGDGHCDEVLVGVYGVVEIERILDHIHGLDIMEKLGLNNVLLCII